MTPPRMSAGFTLIEVVLAAVLLGIAMLGVGHSLSVLQRKAEPADQRLIANLLLQNALERALLAGAQPSDSLVGTVSVFPNDSVGPGGPYIRTITSTVVCNAALLPNDNAASPPGLAGCPVGTNPLRRWTVQVTYQDPSQPSGRGILAGSVTLGIQGPSIRRGVE